MPERRGLVDFLEQRLGIFSAFAKGLSQKQPPQGIGYLQCLGYAALTVMGLQFLSGMALAFHYVPSVDLAYDSIRALEQDVPYGKFTRSLHHIGASALVVLAIVHMLRVYFTGAYKAPRELTWLSGLCLLGLVLAFGFTGYLLPWDQKAYFATKVGTEIAADTPVIGEQLRTILRGGETVGAPTLTRFYVIHVVLLPLALLVLLLGHLYLIQRHGVTAPGRRVGDSGQAGPTYFPYHTFKEAVVGLVAGGLVFYLAYQFPAPLEALAEPSDTSYDPQPDWYFLGFFELLKIFTGELQPLGTFWLPAILMGILVLVPFVDRGRERQWRKRKFMTSLGILAALAGLGLTVVGAINPPQNEPTLPYPLGYTDTEKHGYLMVRRLKCGECHKYEEGGTTYGKQDFEAPDLDEIDQEPEDVAAILENPKEVIESEDMPAFDYIPYEDRRAVGVYLRRLFKDGEKRRKGKGR